MNKIIPLLSAAVLVSALSFTAHAATMEKKDAATAKHQASCKAQAAKKYTAVHFLKRRAYVKECMGQKA
jgi:hypothetical protein